MYYISLFQCTNYAVLETCPNPIHLLRQYLSTLIKMLLTPSLVLPAFRHNICVEGQKHNWDARAQLTCRAQRTDAQLGLGLRWQLVADESVASHNYLLNPDSPLPLWGSRHKINMLSIITNKHQDDGSFWRSEAPSNYILVSHDVVFAKKLSCPSEVPSCTGMVWKN